MFLPQQLNFLIPISLQPDVVDLKILNNEFCQQKSVPFQHYHYQLKDLSCNLCLYICLSICLYDHISGIL